MPQTNQTGAEDLINQGIPPSPPKAPLPPPPLPPVGGPLKKQVALDVDLQEKLDQQMHEVKDEVARLLPVFQNEATKKAAADALKALRQKYSTKAGKVTKIINALQSKVALIKDTLQQELNRFNAETESDQKRLAHLKLEQDQLPDEIKNDIALFQDITGGESFIQEKQERLNSIPQLIEEIQEKIAHLQAPIDLKKQHAENQIKILEKEIALKTAWRTQLLAIRNAVPDPSQKKQAQGIENAVARPPIDLNKWRENSMLTAYDLVALENFIRIDENEEKRSPNEIIQKYQELCRNQRDPNGEEMPGSAVIQNERQIFGIIVGFYSRKGLCKALPQLFGGVQINESRAGVLEGRLAIFYEKFPEFKMSAPLNAQGKPDIHLIKQELEDTTKRCTALKNAPAKNTCVNPAAINNLNPFSGKPKKQTEKLQEIEDKLEQLNQEALKNNPPEKVFKLGQKKVKLSQELDQQEPVPMRNPKLPAEENGKTQQQNTEQKQEQPELTGQSLPDLSKTAEVPASQSIQKTQIQTEKKMPRAQREAKNLKAAHEKKQAQQKQQEKIKSKQQKEDRGAKKLSLQKKNIEALRHNATILEQQTQAFKLQTLELKAATEALERERLEQEKLLGLNTSRTPTQVLSQYLTQHPGDYAGAVETTYSHFQAVNKRNPNANEAVNFAYGLPIDRALFNQALRNPKYGFRR